MRRNTITIIAFLILAVLLASGLLLVVLFRNKRVADNDQKQTPRTEIGKPTVPGPDNIGPQGPALLPTKEPTDINKEE